MLSHGLWHLVFGLLFLFIVSTALLWSQIATWEGLLVLVTGVPLWVVAYGWWYERCRRR